MGDYHQIGNADGSNNYPNIVYLNSNQKQQPIAKEQCTVCNNTYDDNTCDCEWIPLNKFNISINNSTISNNCTIESKSISLHQNFGYGFGATGFRNLLAYSKKENNVVKKPGVYCRVCSEGKPCLENAQCTPDSFYTEHWLYIYGKNKGRKAVFVIHNSYGNEKINLFFCRQ